MNVRVCATVLVAAGALLVTGCASTRTATNPSVGSTAPATQMMPGMVMPDGSTMGATTTSAAELAAGSPSAAETMICGDEIHATITTILGLPHPPSSAATWREHLYVCTYRLPMGTLIVSVKQSSDSVAAKTYFRSTRTALAASEALDGLGQGSYGNASGIVVLIKDNDTLTVDATRLPAVFGTQQSKRFDFAYELASDILGCWTGG